jgi:hypothetical protein
LFSETTESLEVTTEDLDNLVRSGGGIATTLEHLRKFDLAGRRFKSFHMLPPVMKHAVGTNTHVSDEARFKLVNWMNSDCNVFSEASAEGLEVTGADLDHLIMSAGGLDKLLVHLQKLDSEQKKYSSYHELVPAVQALSGISL